MPTLHVKRRGRLAKYTRPEWCQHKPRVEHVYNVCYACSSTLASAKNQHGIKKKRAKNVRVE